MSDSNKKIRVTNETRRDLFIGDLHFGPKIQGRDPSEDDDAPFAHEMTAEAFEDLPDHQVERLRSEDVARGKQAEIRVEKV
jgi:hypothetical protein